MPHLSAKTSLKNNSSDERKQVTIPYIYLLHNKITNQVYYGCRYAKNCHPDDLWTKYFTSSKYVKELISLYGKDSFEFEIRKTFNSQNESRQWEHRVLRRMKVIKDTRFLNQTDNISISPEAASKGMKGKFGENCPTTGRRWKLQEEQKKNRSGKNNHMFGKTGEKSYWFGKKNPFTQEAAKRLANCPHCGKIANFQNIARWHNENCKLKEK